MLLGEDVSLDCNFKILVPLLYTTFSFYLHCDVSYRIGKKVPDVIYVEVFLNQVDPFLSRDVPFGFKVDNIYTVKNRPLQMVSEPDIILILFSSILM